MIQATTLAVAPDGVYTQAQQPTSRQVRDGGGGWGGTVTSHHTGCSHLGFLVDGPIGSTVTPNFNGENVQNDGESFSEWIERLEMVAGVCNWNEQTKFVNVATRLRGPAFRFYSSCTPQQRSSYAQLAKVLRKRFTPVRLQSVQSSLFHKRKQRTNPPETVDNYAQELRKLFHCAYTMATQEQDRMGEDVLAYQFVAGLIDPTEG